MPVDEKQEEEAVENKEDKGRAWVVGKNRKGSLIDNAADKEKVEDKKEEVGKQSSLPVWECLLLLSVFNAFLASVFHKSAKEVAKCLALLHNLATLLGSGL